MGDRTTVTLSVLESQEDKAREYFEFEDNEAWLDEPLSYHQFDEINHGELDFLHKLKAAGIAYESRWDRGYEYGPGVKSLRFTPDGNVVEKEIYDSECAIDLKSLMPLLDKPEELREYILTRHQEVSTLSWENQEEYGKLYRAKQLIST